MDVLTVLSRTQRFRSPRRCRRLVTVAVVSALGASSLLGLPGTASARDHDQQFLRPGNLLLSRTTYVGTAGTVTPGRTVLPAGCTTGCVLATSDGSYPGVFNNEQVDPSFGVSSPIFLDQLGTDGQLINTLAVPDGTGDRRSDRSNRLVTSFPSKSELALNLSTSGQYVTFMGYVAPASALDVSNSNTPGVIDPSNPVGTSVYRAVAQVDATGHFQFTETNAYSGNNGRAAVLDDSRGAHVYYAAGNSGNGGTPEPVGVIAGAGAQLIHPSWLPEWAQHPPALTPVGSFNITALGVPADKIGKDTNFRGLTVYRNVVYLSKGSGGNGVNTVYFIDTTGKACPNGGVGVPQPGAALPASGIGYDPATLQAQGLAGNMCILRGFPTALKSKTSFPFGLWFADPDTLYVANEGNADTTYSAAGGVFTAAAAQAGAGLQKWVRTAGTWHLAYTLQNGLDLGHPYTVPGYPTGENPVTGLPWAPATDGLRNITGRVNDDGTATIWAVTSTISGATDVGADPNKVLAVTDRLSAQSAPAGVEHFTTVRSAATGQALRGISFTPGTGVAHER